MDFKEIDAKLKAPFEEKDIQWRLQSCGMTNGKLWGRCLAYLDSRAVQERLDEVVGPDNWQSVVHKEGDSYLCSLSIRVTHNDGTTEWITRTDGSDSSDIEAVKGGISGAFKRSAVLFGVGRYLYNLKDSWAIIKEDGKYSGKTKEGTWFNWDAPSLPDWALPPVDENEFKSLVQSVLDYINTNIITGDQIAKTEQCVADKNVGKLREIVSWCKKQEKKGAKKTEDDIKSL